MSQFMRHRFIVLAIIVFVVSACSDLAGEVQIVETVEPQANNIAQSVSIDLPPNTPDVANGARIYQQNCTSCHGLEGAGDGELVESGDVPRIGSFLDPVHMRQQSVEFYYDIITNGNLINLMPPWANALSLQERWDVLMYVYTLQYTPEQIAQGEALAASVASGLQLQSDTQLAQASSLDGEDAFAALAYQRVQAVRNWGEEAAEATEEPMAFETITFSGQVTQGSPNAALPSDLIVQLQYGDFLSTPNILDATLDAEGRFSFEAVPAEASSTYFAVAFSDGRAFISDAIESDELQAINPVDITVYETSNAPNIVNQTGLNLVMDYLTVPDVGSGLVINQSGAYENPTDYIFHLEPEGQDIRVSLLISLPIGAIFLEQPEESIFIPVPDQFSLIDTRPVYPGEHFADTSYFIPYENTAQTVDIRVNNRFTGEVNITLIDPELRVTGEGFAFDQEVNLGTEETPIPANRYTATLDLQPGDSIVFDIEGRVNLNTSEDSGVLTQDQLIPILIGIVVGVLVLFGGVIVFIRRSGNSPQRQIEALMSEIERLEALHNDGQLNHDVFQSKRQELKAKLEQLMAEQNNT